MPESSDAVITAIPRISVALVTRNRPDSLLRTLKSLRSQSEQPFEVLVSDDSDDEQGREVAELAQRFSCRYLRGPRRGLYANRNFVAAACMGTHVRTMDDDHEFPERHFEQCQRAVERDPNSVWIIGEFLPGQETPGRPPHCPGQLNPRGSSSTPENPDDCWAISGSCAGIYPRAIFERGIWMAEDFKFGAAYLEFGCRLKWLGYRMRFLDSTYVVHHYDPANRSVMNPAIDIGSSIFAMLSMSRIYQPSFSNEYEIDLSVGSARHIANAICVDGF